MPSIEMAGACSRCGPLLLNRRFRAVLVGLVALSCAENPPVQVSPPAPGAAKPSTEHQTPPEAQLHEPTASQAADSASPTAQPTDNQSLPVQAEQGASQKFRPAIVHLDRFYGRLAELEQDEAKAPLRILWLGDSHTAADFLTDAVRNELWSRFRAGGPGFVHAGLRGTRHGGLNFESAGRFRSQPRAPASRERSLDGIFGYGGIRTVPEPGAWMRMISPRLGVGEVTLTYRLRPGDRLEVRLNGARVELPAPEYRDTLQHATWKLEDDDPPFNLWLRGLAGAPELFGVDLLSEKPGLVLDTVGINGARLATPLAWDEGSFEAEVERRNLSLFVIAFGTNEAFDNRNAAQYASDLREVILRLTRASPRAACWVLGPPDCNTKKGEPNERVRAISSVLEKSAGELGCGYTSQAELMQAEGGFTGWKSHSPPWARPDNIHLTVQGYQELGRRLAHVLLGDATQKPSESASLWSRPDPRFALFDTPP